MGLTREAICGYIEDNFCELKAEAVERFVNRLSFLTPEEVCERLLSEKYIEFDIESIPAEAQLEDAMLSILFLCAFADLQTDH